jgi:hypothetical protein
MSLREIVTDPDLVYVDHAQPDSSWARTTPGFEIAHLRWQVPEGEASCDYAWLNKGKLWGVEEKRGADLVSSANKRRLQRQLRELVVEVDVPVLALRLDYDPWDGAVLTLELGEGELVRLMRWLSEWPGRTLWLPDSLGLSDTLSWARTGLTSPKLGVLAGTDRKRPKAPTQFQTWLRRLFTGVGAKTATRLESGFKGKTFAQALKAGPAQWHKAGAHVGIIRQLEAMQ